MKKLFLALLLAAVGAALITGLLSSFDRPTAVDYARQQAALAALERQAAIDAFWAPIRAAAWNVTIIGALAGGLYYLWAMAGAHVARVRSERRPDARGLLPVDRSSLVELAGPALGAYHAAALASAQRPVLPHSLTYSPHYSQRTDAAALLPGDGAPALLGSGIPTFAQLLHSGRVGRGPDGRALPLLLGFDLEAEGGPAELSGSWLDLYSTAVGGLPGSGKTTTQRFLACQTALAGARFVVIDPHAGAGPDSLAATLAPLSAAYLCEAASDDRRILEAVRLVAEMGEARVTGRDRDATPIILWADELTKLLGRSAIGDELGQLLEAVAQEYRKKGVFVCGSGQIWTAARTTSELRDSFASVIAHRMKRSQARMLLPTEEAAAVERLEVGQAVLWRTSGATATIAVPLTTGADVVTVAGLLAGDAPRYDFRAASAQDATGRHAEAGWTHHGSHVEGTPDAPSSAAARANMGRGPLDPEAARILAGFTAGKSIPDLVRELVGSTSGRRADEARARVERILRANLGRPQA